MSRIFMLLIAVPIVTLSSVLPATCWAKENNNREIVELSLKPKAATAESEAIRFLPSTQQLKPGNAAVVLLRMPYEQQFVINEIFPNVLDLLELKFDDPRIENEFTQHYSRFYSGMKRAAYMGQANWYYPLDQKPVHSILIPDVQSMRQYAGRGLSLWIATQIKHQDFAAAHEALTVQFACGRHVARTPFFVCTAVGNSIGKYGLRRVHDLINQDQASNYYHALGSLPMSLGNSQAIIDFETSLIAQSLPSLSTPYPPVGDPKWKMIASEFLQIISCQLPEPFDPTEARELQNRLVKLATEELPTLTKFKPETINTMLDEERVMRMILFHVNRFEVKQKFALTLPTDRCIASLAESAKEIQHFEKRAQMPVNLFTHFGFHILFGLHSFGRQAKRLQTVEAIRDYAAKKGKLPQSLSDTFLQVPNDPLTGRPFVYKAISETKAELDVEPVVDDKLIDLLPEQYREPHLNEPIFRLELDVTIEP